MKTIITIVLLALSLGLRAQGNVGIGTVDPQAKLHVDTGAVLFSGIIGTTPVSGAGTRMMWIPEKGAFRAGSVSGTEWDDILIGQSSFASGEDNLASGLRSFIGGGVNNNATHQHSFIGGGASNQANDNAAAIIGGTSNTASGSGSATAGGFGNMTNGKYAFAAGGESLRAEAYAEVVIGRYNFFAIPGNPDNWNSSDRVFSIGNGTSAINRANALTVLKNGNIGVNTPIPSAKLEVKDGSVLFIGNSGTLPPLGAGTRLMWIPTKGAFRAGTVTGGQWDFISMNSFGSGLDNELGPVANQSFIAGGQNNFISSENAFIGAGSENSALASESFIGGGNNNRASGTNAFVGGGTFNSASNLNAFIGGGEKDTASAAWSFVGGGYTNRARSIYAFVGGGLNNVASGIGSFVGGGNSNSTNRQDSFIGGGGSNTVSLFGDASFIGAGSGNQAHGSNSFIAAGQNNLVSGFNGFTGAGQSLLAKSFSEAVFGRYNEDYNPMGGTFNWDPDDRLFVVGNGTSEGSRSNALTLLKNGNLGIGTSSPNARLAVNSGGSFIVQTLLSSSTVGSWLTIGNSDTGGRYFQLISSGSANGGGAGNLLIGHGASPGSVAGIPLVIRGDNNRVGIGTDNPATLLHVNGDITASCGVLICSDRRYKTNITPLSHTLDKIQNLRGMYYHWDKSQYPEKAFTDERQIGVIAQELEAQFPELVHTDDEGYKTVDYPKMSAVLLTAVNELSANQQRIMEENALLKDQLDEVMSMLNELTEENVHVTR